MRPVKWMIDEDTCVEIEDTSEGTEIWLRQGSSTIVRFAATEASPADAVQSLLAAIIATEETGVFDMPDLTPFGYQPAET